ncbi:MAG: TolC family protein [Opitutales bacterium]|jgi:outer membrane protein TolC
MHPLRISIAALLIAGSALKAQDAQVLTLSEAVAQALHNNLDLRIQKYEPLIAKDTVKVQEAAFDIRLDASAGAGGDKSALTGDATSSGFATAGATKMISTGATVGLTTTLDHSPALAKDSNTALTASITQPLLRGAWSDVTLAELRKAQSSMTQSQLQLRSKALDLILGVSTQYWNLSHARENVELLKSSVHAAELLVEESRAKLDAGLATDIDLLQAQASLSEKQEALTQAELAIFAAGDELAQSMGTLLEQAGTSFNPSVAALPTDLSKSFAFEQIWPGILAADLDSAMQEEAIRRADLERIQASNGRLPQVDLVLETGLSGSDSSEKDSYDSLANGDGHDWSTTLKFSMPLGRRADIARSRQSQSRLEQAKIQLIAVKQALYKKARQAWRDVELGVDRCNSAKARVEYQSVALDRAKSRYSNNLISFRELLDAQKDFDDARLMYINALRDLAVARATMARLQGGIGEVPGMNDFNTDSIKENTSK